MTKEQCGSCDQMKKENATVRKALMDTNKNYVEVVNENLALHREIETLRVRLDEAQLRSIEASNPGIDMEEVKASRVNPPTSINLPELRKCTNCGGSGRISISRLHPSDPNQDWWESHLCVDCRGTGKKTVSPRVCINPGCKQCLPDDPSTWSNH